MSIIATNRWIFCHKKIIFPQSQKKIVKKFPQLYNFRSGKVSKFALFWKKLSRFALFREKRQIITFFGWKFPSPHIFPRWGNNIFQSIHLCPLIHLHMKLHWLGQWPSYIVYKFICHYLLKLDLLDLPGHFSRCRSFWKQQKRPAWQW